MKRILLAATAIAAFAAVGSAGAADLPVKAPPMAPVIAPVYDWTGFYIGINGGYSWGRANDTFATPVGTFAGTQDLNGWVFGGQLGYNWQFNRNWLFGLEADIQATGQKGDAALPAFVGTPVCPINTIAVLPCVTTTTTAAFEQKMPWFGTARARLGFLPAPTWLLYVTGGLAYGEVETNGAIGTTAVTAFIGGPAITTVSAVAAASNNVTKAGWTVGAGSEWVISGPWTAKIEYLYVDLGTVTNSFTGLGAFAPLSISSHVTDNIVRAGINYRFGGPVIAKY